MSFPFLQANTEYSLLCQNSLFTFHSLLSSLSLMSPLTLVSSVSLTHPCSSIYTSWSTENSSVFNPCCREPVQHTVTQSTDYLLIQSHANTVTLNRPLTHALSLHTDTCYQVSYHNTRRWGVVQGLSVATTYSITWCAQPLRGCSASVQIMGKKWWKKMQWSWIIATFSKNNRWGYTCLPSKSLMPRVWMCDKSYHIKLWLVGLLPANLCFSLYYAQHYSFFRSTFFINYLVPLCILFPVFT